MAEYGNARTYPQATRQELIEFADNGVKGQGAVVQTMFRLMDATEAQEKIAERLNTTIVVLTVVLVVLTVVLVGVGGAQLYYQLHPNAAKGLIVQQSVVGRSVQEGSPNARGASGANQKDGITLHSPNYNAVTREYEVPPCPDNEPISWSLVGYCVLSGVVVENFRPEMCVGKILENGDCQTPAVSNSNFGPGIQLCPYGLAINAQGECPSWDVFDRVGAEQKLREYRAQHK